MNAIISYAIGNKLLLTMAYKNMFRIVEPYFYGIDLNGNHVLYAFQTEGESLSGEAGWRFFELSNAEDIELHRQHFDEVREGYWIARSNMEIIFCEVGI